MVRPASRASIERKYQPGGAARGHRVGLPLGGGWHCRAVRGRDSTASKVIVARFAPLSQPSSPLCLFLLLLLCEGKRRKRQSGGESPHSKEQPLDDAGSLTRA